MPSARNAMTNATAHSDTDRASATARLLAVKARISKRNRPDRNPAITGVPCRKCGRHQLKRV